MQSKDEKNDANFGQEEETDLAGTVQGDEQFDSEDADPPLDEEDLEENNLAAEAADQIVWDLAKTGSSGGEEKGYYRLDK
ncbi:MAG: hypothetical protein ACR2KZ_09435 [Segetibacter sp.]